MIPAVAEVPASGVRGRRWFVPAAFAAGVVATLTVGMFRSAPALTDQSGYRSTPFSFEPGGQRYPVWSPDGKTVAYAARSDQAAPYQIYVRSWNLRRRSS